MTEVPTYSTAEFRANCLDILDLIGTRRVGRVLITEGSRTVAVLLSPETEARGAQAGQMHGFLRGSVAVPSGLDLTAPVHDDPTDAEDGLLHR